MDLKLFSHWGLITQSAALKILTRNSLWDWDGWEVEKLIQHSGPEGAKAKAPLGNSLTAAPTAAVTSCSVTVWSFSLSLTP